MVRHLASTLIQFTPRKKHERNKHTILFTRRNYISYWSDRYCYLVGICISNDVEELKRDRDDIRMMVDHLDVLTYRIESLEATIDRAFGKEMR